MRTGSVLFLVGILVLLQFRELPPSNLLLTLPACTFLVWKSRWLRWPAFFASGFLWALFRADTILSDRLEPDQEGQTVIVEGKVTHLPVVSENRVRFDFITERLIDSKGRRGKAPGVIRLTWYRDFPPLAPAEKWRLAVRLKRPRGLRNPGGFDYEGWLFQHKVGASGYVLGASPENRRLEKASGVSVHRIRNLIRLRLHEYLETDPAGALIPALVIGDRSGLSFEQWQVLTRTGTSHLLAISGLHIGIIAGLGYVITLYLWPWTGLAVLGLATPRAAALVSMTGAVVYAALAGFAVPTQRALPMVENGSMKISGSGMAAVGAARGC